MRIISRKHIRLAKEEFPSMSTSLDGWYKVVSKNSFQHYSDLKKTFNSVDKVGPLYVFDIGGNKI